MATYSLRARVTLVDWPSVTFTTEPFSVETKACSFSNLQWTSTTNTQLEATYTIASPGENYEFSYDVADISCEIEIQV